MSTTAIATQASIFGALPADPERLIEERETHAVTLRVVYDLHPAVDSENDQVRSCVDEVPPAAEWEQRLRLAGIDCHGVVIVEADEVVETFPRDEP